MNNINDIYYGMENDLHLHSGDNEDPASFHCRLVYSGIANWILSLSTDRDSNEPDSKNDFVLKTHVTNVSRDILLSFIKADPALKPYFFVDKVIDFINFVEDSYVSLGYFENDDYRFKAAKYKTLIRLIGSNLVLHVDYPCRFHGMTGLGLYRVAKEEDSKGASIDDYLCISQTALGTFKSLADSLKYQPFVSEAVKGRVEFYHPVKKRWLPFSEEDSRLFDYLILRFDNMAYSFLKKMGNNVYISPLPVIYNPISKDSFHQREIWRIILGYCAFLGYNFEAVYHFDKATNLCFLNFEGFILPGKENAFLHCLYWPQRDCLDVFQSVTRPIFVPTIKYVLSLFDVTLKEG